MIKSLQLYNRDNKDYGLERAISHDNTIRKKLPLLMVWHGNSGKNDSRTVIFIATALSRKCGEYYYRGTIVRSYGELPPELGTSKDLSIGVDTIFLAEACTQFIGKVELRNVE